MDKELGWYIKRRDSTHVLLVTIILSFLSFRFPCTKPGQVPSLLYNCVRFSVASQLDFFSGCLTGLLPIEVVAGRLTFLIVLAHFIFALNCHSLEVNHATALICSYVSFGVRPSLRGSYSNSCSAPAPC
ncbi:hypothetical protein BS17DRAFT_143280 [Gyrodon lividus]|nr:hypothetical protein BS17DRAFT_143280 [Gyrodon lividus]